MGGMNVLHSLSLEMFSELTVCLSLGSDRPPRDPQRAKFAEKVHKPPLGVNVINFKLNWFNASIIYRGPLESLRVQKVTLQ